MKVHLDTDFAGDTDDAAALAMLLGWPDADVVSITTTADPDGWRAGYVHHLLELGGRDDIPVASGAGASLAGRSMGGLPDHGAYWGDATVTPTRSRPGAEVDLLASAIDAGAAVIAIGPYTNLARFDDAYPGALARSDVTVMGGWLGLPDASLPQWGPEMDWNVQCDTAAAQRVFEATDNLLLVTLAATMRAHVHGADLDRLGASGPIGRLLARQARAHAVEHRMPELARGHAGLPEDLCNFQYDPVACAAALGWPHTTTETMRLAPRFEGDLLRFLPSEHGELVGVVQDVNGPAFSQAWLRAIESAERS